MPYGYTWVAAEKVDVTATDISTLSEYTRGTNTCQLYAQEGNAWFTLNDKGLVLADGSQPGTLPINEGEIVNVDGYTDIANVALIGNGGACTIQVNYYGIKDY